MPLTVDGFIPATGAPPGAGFYNSNRDAPTDPTVPALIEETGDTVREFLNLNRGFVTNAIALANDTIGNLKTAILPPQLPDPPAAPTITTSFSAELGLGFESVPDLGQLSPQSIDAFHVDAVVIPDIESDIPTHTSLGLSINIPDSPTLDTVAEPAAPGLDLTFNIPAVPAKDYGGPPDLDQITIPAYTAPVLPVFNDSAPTFATLPPQPFIQWQEPVYLSGIKDATHDVIVEMLAGGTGIPADVENAIWERGRQREDRAALGVKDAAITQWTARGFDHPQGQLNKQIIAIDDDNARKINELSRDVMVKQADMEQSNRRFAVEKGLDYERIFTAIFLAVVERNFQIAKFAVETEIQVYNLQVTAFNVERQVFEAKIAKYRVDLEAALAYLKMFEALVEVEKAKAQMNLAKVQAYEAKVKAFAAQVEAYKAVIQAAGVKADLQKNLAEIYKSQIDGMVAKLNAQRSKFEAYDSRIKGETSKVAMEEANSRVFATRMQGWSEQATVILKRADVELQGNRQTLDWNIANMQRVTALSGTQLNEIQARLASFQANTARGTAKYEADKSSKMAELQANVSLSQVAIAKYGALLEQWKVRAGEIIQYGIVSAESVRAAGQIVSNMLSGALAGTHVSAGITAGASAGQSSSRSSADNTSQTKSVSENDNYSIIHSYAHRT